MTRPISALTLDQKELTRMKSNHQRNETMKRYKIKTGKFGQYFRDTEECKDLPLEEVEALLNGEDMFPYTGVSEDKPEGFLDEDSQRYLEGKQ